MVLDPLQEYCYVNGTQYDRNQCISMANTLAIYARRYYESSFNGLHAGFIAFSVLGGVSLVAALIFGMLLYKQSSLQTVEEKRKKIRAELESAMPTKGDGDGEEDGLNMD